MIITAIPVYSLNTHCRMVNRKTFKLAVVIACIEYETTAMLPLKPVTKNELRFHIHAGIIPVSILQDYRFDLVVGSNDRKIAVFEFHFNLLMCPIEINIRIGSAGQFNVHGWVNNHETGVQHQFFILVIDAHFVVTTLGYAALVVGQSKGIVGVFNVRIDRFLYVLNDKIIAEPL